MGNDVTLVVDDEAVGAIRRAFLTRASVKMGEGGFLFLQTPYPSAITNT
jgi:hypothetical protein